MGQNWIQLVQPPTAAPAVEGEARGAVFIPRRRVSIPRLKLHDVVPPGVQHSRAPASEHGGGSGSGALATGAGAYPSKEDAPLRPSIASHSDSHGAGVAHARRQRRAAPPRAERRRRELGVGGAPPQPRG
jgi:hypothetical protein